MSQIFKTDVTHDGTCWNFCCKYLFSHIREHLDGVMDMDQDRMTEEETQFRYFKIHDYDSNNKLDGIELIAALTHYHKGNMAFT